MKNKNYNFAFASNKVTTAPLNTVPVADARVLPEMRDVRSETMLSRRHRAVLRDFSGRQGWKEEENDGMKRGGEGGMNGSAREWVVLSSKLDMNNRRARSREGMLFGEVTVLFVESERMQRLEKRNIRSMKF